MAGLTTRKYTIPKGTDVFGEVGGDNQVHLLRDWAAYLRGLEDTSGRVAEYTDPNTATVADVVNALITAKLMKPE